MAATEELRILLRTVADTSGAKQTEQSLKGLSEQSAGSAKSLALMGAAAGVASAGVALAVDKLGDLARFMGDSVQTAREHERVIRATGMAYGQAAGQYTQFAQQLSAATGFTSDAILEAALSARTLSQNYGLTIQQTQKLISVSADLARVRGIGVAESFERIQSAIRGEAEASEYLGLTLNDTYLTNQAMNGSLKTTFGTMTDLQKAQVRYNEVLKQSEQFSGLASKATDSLDAAFGRAENSSRNLQTVIGEITKPATVAGMNALAEAADRLAKNLATQGQGPGTERRLFIEELLKGQSLVGALQTAEKRLQDQRIRDAERLRDLEANIGPATDAAEIKRQQTITQRVRDLERLRDLEANTTGTPMGTPLTSDTAATLARLAYLDQVSAAVRDIQSAQSAQVELQQQSVELAAREAQIKLSLLPTQERLAELQRSTTEAQLRARAAALPATEALEDLRFAQERARLIAGSRDIDAEQRREARRSLRGLAHAEPGVQLSALEAGRSVTLAGRAAERVGIEAQLFQVANERALAQVQAAETTNQLLAQIAAQRTQAIELTINLRSADFQQQVYKELVEASAQSQTPPVVQQSGVRR